MDFKSRFKGKMTVMNKEGVIGIVNKPSMPIIKNNQYFTNESSPTIKKPFLHNDSTMESKSHIFTNIQLQQNKKPYNLQNAGSEVLRQSKMKTEMNHYDEQKPTNRFSLKLHQHMNQVDMDEYEIVAIPRNMLGQLRQQISVDRYALTHSFAPDREQTFKFKQGSPGMNSYQATPLHKQHTIEQHDFLKPPLFKQQSERFEKKNKTIQQAGLGTLRNNSYSKR